MEQPTQIRADHTCSPPPGSAASVVRGRRLEGPNKGAVASGRIVPDTPKATPRRSPVDHSRCVSCGEQLVASPTAPASGGGRCGSASRMLTLPACEQTSPSGYAARRERELLLAGALETLPEDQRTAVELRYIGDCSLAEIAASMSRTKPSVAGLIRRGLQDLRGRLKPLD